MEDKLLTLFFETKRWQEAISKGIGKDIPKGELRRLVSPETRMAIYRAMRDGTYLIAPPHTALIPKDKPGEFRTVYINEPIDRVVLGIANDLLFEACPDMIHPSCRSYLKGTGCSQTVEEASRRVAKANGKTIGWKSDLSKYFDSVPVEFIDEVFDKVEVRHGHSALIDVLRKYYHSDLYFDEHNNLARKYQSLKQGCAVAAFLADAVLYDLDERMSGMKGFFRRYSDDDIYIGEDYEEAMRVLQQGLAEKGLSLNPKKVEYLSDNRWFKFLGFSIKGTMITLSSSRIKTFQKEIESRTIKAGRISYARALRQVNQYLYKGDGQFSWATQVLRTCNVKKDIDTLNAYVMDCLRAVKSGRKHVGGLGYDGNGKDGCIQRGKGRNVTANRQETGNQLPGFLSIGCLQRALRTRKALYETLVSNL